ncbi:MAG: (Fe-S)-binding protein [Promethearchaeota archaeon]
MTKLLYLGCLSRNRFKNTCENAIKLVQAIDPEYAVLEDAPCCGSLTFHVSNDQELKKHVEFVNQWFKDNNVEKLVTICAGCYRYLTGYYPELLKDDFKVEVKHLLQFMAEDVNLKKLNLKNEKKKLVVNYHDACHLKNADPPILEEPRKILNSIENVEVFEMENNRLNSICCGAGGGVYSIFKENSDYNAKTIFDQMRKGKALLTACPFCYNALTRIREENNIKKPVIKFEDFIVKLMEGEDPLK